MHIYIQDIHVYTARDFLQDYPLLVSVYVGPQIQKHMKKRIENYTILQNVNICKYLFIALKTDVLTQLSKAIPNPPQLISLISL